MALVAGESCRKQRFFQLADFRYVNGFAIQLRSLAVLRAVGRGPGDMAGFGDEQFPDLSVQNDADDADNVEVVAYCNVLTSVAFLEGMATRELRRHALETHDPQFPMVVTVRAYRPQTDGESALAEVGLRGPASS